MSAASSVGSALHHMSAAWLAAAVPYLLDVDRLPAPWLTVMLSTYVGALAALTSGLGLPGPTRHAAPAAERRVAAVPPAPVTDVRPSRGPHRDVAPHRKSARDYERAGDPYAHAQCPNCGDFDTAIDIDHRRCRTCDHRWSGDLADPVEIRSWLHHT